MNYVVSLCDKTGNMVRPWANAGCTCYCIDVQHKIRSRRVEKVGKGKIIYVWGDVRTWFPEKRIVDHLRMVFAFPPCTHVTISGARDHQTKGTALLRDSLEIFNACEFAANWAGAPYMIENPVGSFSTHIRKPDYYFQPWMYGDNYNKHTCLWTGNGFSMPRTVVLKKGFILPDSMVEKNGFIVPKKIIVKKPRYKNQLILAFGPSKDRADQRSITPVGFSNAVFENNKHLIVKILKRRKG